MIQLACSTITGLSCSFSVSQSSIDFMIELLAHINKVHDPQFVPRCNNDLLGRDRKTLSRGKLLAMTSVAILLTFLLLYPGFMVIQENQAREEYANEFSDQLLFETGCYVEEVNTSIDYTCGETEFLYLLSELNRADKLLLSFEFLTDFVYSQFENSPYLIPQLIIEGENSELTLGIFPGSYAFIAPEKGSYLLRFLLNPSIRPLSDEYDLTQIISVVVQMIVEINPQLQEIPLQTYFAWFPVAILLVVIMGSIWISRWGSIKGGN